MATLKNCTLLKDHHPSGFKMGKTSSSLADVSFQAKKTEQISFKETTKAVLSSFFQFSIPRETHTHKKNQPTACLSVFEWVPKGEGEKEELKYYKGTLGGVEISFYKQRYKYSIRNIFSLATSGTFVKPPVCSVSPKYNSPYNVSYNDLASGAR